MCRETIQSFKFFYAHPTGHNRETKQEHPDSIPVPRLSFHALTLFMQRKYLIIFESQPLLQFADVFVPLGQPRLQLLDHRITIPQNVIQLLDLFVGF